MTQQNGGRSFATWIGAALAWLACCVIPAAAAMLGVLSAGSHRSQVEIENALPALVIGQAFFVLLIWPLFEWRAAGGCRWQPICRLMGLLALSAPLVILARRTAVTDISSAVLSQALVFLLGVTSASAIRLQAWQRWYYPAMLVWAGVLPLASFWLYQGGLAPAWAIAVSPFWAAGSVGSGGDAVAPLIVFAIIAASLLAASLLRRKPQHS